MPSPNQPNQPPHYSLRKVRNSSSSPYLELYQSVEEEDNVPSVVELAVECEVITQEEADAVGAQTNGGSGGGGGGSGGGDGDALLQSIPSSLRAMLRKFHELGLIWWYHSAPELAETIILSPQWIIDNMAFIARDFRLHRLRRDDKAMDERMEDWVALTRRAEVSPAILRHNLWRNVPQHEQEFLRNILKRFLLCAEISEKPGWLHFPSVLTAVNRLEAPPKPEGARKVFCFEFSFLPTGLFEKIIVSILQEWRCADVLLQRQVVQLSLPHHKDTDNIRMVLVSSASIETQEAIEIWVHDDQTGLSDDSVATLVDNVWYYLARVERLYFGGEGRVKYTPVVFDPSSSPALVKLVEGRTYRARAPPPPPTSEDVQRQSESLADKEKEAAAPANTGTGTAAEEEDSSAALAEWLTEIHKPNKHWKPTKLASALEEEGYETPHDLKSWLEDDGETEFKNALNKGYALKMPQIRKLIEALKTLPAEPEPQPDRVLAFLGGEHLKLEDEKESINRLKPFTALVHDDVEKFEELDAKLFEATKGSFRVLHLTCHGQTAQSGRRTLEFLCESGKIVETTTLARSIQICCRNVSKIEQCLLDPTRRIDCVVLNGGLRNKHTRQTPVYSHPCLSSRWARCHTRTRTHTCI